MAERWQVDRLVDDVATVSRRGLPRERFFAEVGARLRRVVDADAMCWHTLDPHTALLTSDSPRELVDIGVFTRDSIGDAGERLVASEYFVDDVNTFASLAGRRTPVGILSRTTAGKPERSTRYRELLEPAGIPFEMRAAFVSRGRAWGAVHLARRADRAEFSAADAAVLARVGPAVADGIRTFLRFDAARRPGDASAPGLVVLNDANDIELISGPAGELMAAMRNDVDGVRALPSSVLALANFVRQRPDGPGGVAVPSPAGWVTLHASLPDGAKAGRVAIVLDRAASPEATAVRLEAHSVTAREREVAALLARGLTYSDIAEALVLSPHTVQDHIKSLFEKTGVASRQELVARIFLDDYLPQIARQSGLGSTGGFATNDG